jgi:hypothetical protein
MTVANAGSPGRARISRQTTAQGMFWRKNINKIKAKGVLCPPLCRDLRKLLIAVENSPWRAGAADTYDEARHD